MGLEQVQGGNIIYLGIGADGKLRQTVTSDTPGAVMEEFTDQKTKETKQYWRLKHSAVRGYITSMDIVEGDFGTQIKIFLESEDKTFCVNVGTNTAFGQSLLAKLPNLPGKGEEIRIAPYSFENKDKPGTMVRGVNVYETEGAEKVVHMAKINNFFVSRNKKGEFKYVSGYPKPHKAQEKMTREDWRHYFGSVTLFMIDYCRDNILADYTWEKPDYEAPLKRSKVAEEQTSIDKEERPSDDISISDIPF